MEKIYLTDDNSQSQKKQSFFKKFFNDKGSMVATIIVAVVGVAGLVAFGFNQISFAANDKTGASLGESFVSGQGEGTTQVFGETVDGKTSTKILGFHGIIDEEGTRVPVFCIEYNKTFAVGNTYTKGDYISDQGLIYLMSQLYPNKILSRGEEQLDEMVQVWVTQMAIWSYLYEIGDPNNSNFAKNYELVKTTDKLFKGDGSTPESLSPIFTTEGSTVFKTLGVDKLIATAIEYHKKPFINLTINKASDTISMTNDKKYYQTDVISVVGSVSSELINSFESYTIKFNKVPEGTIVVNEKGEEYKNLDNMDPTSKFYIRVPVDKLNNDNKHIQISIVGNFKMYGAHAYVFEDKQKVANVGKLNKLEEKPLEFDFDYTPKVQDTKMSPAQILYFAGLIVLLTGVGIIYVNTKKEETN